MFVFEDPTCNQMYDNELSDAAHEAEQELEQRIVRVLQQIKDGEKPTLDDFHLICWQCGVKPEELE